MSNIELIEELRKAMIDKAKEKKGNFSDEEVLKISEELDKLLIKEMFKDN